MLRGENKAFPPLTIPVFVAFEPCKNRNLERGHYRAKENKTMNLKDVEVFEETWLCRSFLKLKRYRLRHKLFNGGWSGLMIREMVERPQVAAVLPYDPILDKVVLIEQFRPGPVSVGESPWLMEIVAGIAEVGESLEELAHREAKEEANLEILALKLIHHYWVSPGMCDEKVALFCGRVDAAYAGGVHGLVHEHEDIKVHVMDAARVFELAAEGRVNNALSLIGIQWLQLNYKKLRKEWLG